MAKLKITQTESATGQIHDRYAGPEYINGAYVGGTGGLTSQVGRQIQPQVYITGGSSLPGSILLQKGARKFRVTDGSLTGTCTLTNSPNLVAGQLNILINLSTITGAQTTAANVAGGATSTYVTFSTSNVTGPVASPRVGDYIIGFAGTAAVAQVTALNGAGNVTIAVSGNVSAQTATVTDSTYASRITNRYVYDFGNDGSLSTSTAGGYNPNKFRYHLSAADATFVMVNYA